MASKAYMRVEGVKSTRRDSDLAHRGWIILDSVMVGDRPSVGRDASGEPSRKRGSVDFEDVTLVRELDRDSVQLATKCCTGMAHDDIVIDMTDTPKGSGIRRHVHLTIGKAIVVRHNVKKSPKGKGKGKGQAGTEEFLLRCANLTFRQS